MKMIFFNIIIFILFDHIIINHNDCLLNYNLRIDIYFHNIIIKEAKQKNQSILWKRDNNHFNTNLTQLL